MNNRFFEKPILNSPYGYPARHWELDNHGQPTQQIVESRRRAEFITPIPRPRKRRDSQEQASLVLGEGQGLSTAKGQKGQSDEASVTEDSSITASGEYRHKRC
jgi:type III restriction enzyme